MLLNHSGLSIVWRFGHGYRYDKIHHGDEMKGDIQLKFCGHFIIAVFLFGIHMITFYTFSVCYSVCNAYSPYGGLTM